MADAAWITQTLEAMNKLRALHGAPPLEWSEECYESAKKQADTCQEQDMLHHGCTEGSSGQHGQNAFMCSNPCSPADAVEAWYGEVNDPGYNFEKPGFDGTTGHFTQVVWVGTQFVGLAASANRQYIVANFLPPGNFEGLFAENVLPAQP